jgi:flagellar export protein FliJ
VKRYRFRLEQVMRVRRIQEDQARSLVVEARTRAADAAAVTLRRIEAYESHSSAGATVDAAGFLASRALHEAKAQAVLNAQVEEMEAREVVAQRLDGWSEAARRVSALERLDERRREEYDIELRRDEDAQVDDLVVSRQARARAAS